jgi:hypothetical protein
MRQRHQMFSHFAFGWTLQAFEWAGRMPSSAPPSLHIRLLPGQ